MTTCPAGHQSESTDYCDVCGVAISTSDASALPEASAPAEGAVSSGPTADACPNCGAEAPPEALFCEACGYDFTTGTMPRTADPLSAPAASADANPSPAPADSWVAEIWIDPDWYADQGSPETLPSPGVPAVVPLRHTSLLIGRVSHTRGITPDIDVSSDTGVSRRHAQLTTDGTRWWVEDLGSSNGTYVGSSGAGIPATPIAVGQKVELSADDQVYVGAWTRIAVRKALPGEV